MKKNQIYQTKVKALDYPNSGVCYVEDKIVHVKGALPEQQAEIRISKKRRNKIEAKIQTIIVPAPYEIESFCEHFGECGGCARQTIPYQKQLKLKEQAVQRLFKSAGFSLNIEYTIPSPLIYRYRNKMDYSFGDTEKGGQLNLGMHKKGRYYDVVSVPHCHLVDEDYNVITSAVEALCRIQNWPKYNRNTSEGIMRNLVIRKGYFTGEILIGIATSSDVRFDEQIFVKSILDLNLRGNIVGIYHLINNGVADVVKPMPQDHLLYGRDYFCEKINGLTFKVSFHSFFQTNSQGAELLYDKALNLMSALNDKIVYDLFSGTGTIAQIVSRYAKHVYGIEIIEDAVKTARENTAINNINNCTFLAGDVFKILDDVTEKPEIIIVDPPRAGMTPKTVEKIANYKVDEILYISCNPKTMIGNLVDFKKFGYRISSCFLVDLYPHTPHVETVALLSKLDVDKHISVEITMDELDLTSAESKATYKQIKEYIIKNTGLKVSSLNIAQTKRKYGIIERKNYNKAKNESSKVPACTEEKENAIVDALKYFQMV